VNANTEQREAIFVADYLVHGNATKAAEKAGFTKRSARQKGSELLKRPRVAAAIEAGRKQTVRKFNLSGERVMKEMCAIAFSDIRHYVIGVDGTVALAVGAPDSAMRAIKRLKRKVRTIPVKEGEPIVEVETEIELWNKDAELTALGRTKHLKLFTESDRDEGILALGAAMQAAEQRIANNRDTAA
jgi:phage terminase small subunit